MKWIEKKETKAIPNILRWNQKEQKTHQPYDIYPKQQACRSGLNKRAARSELYGWRGRNFSKNSNQLYQRGKGAEQLLHMKFLGAEGHGESVWGCRAFDIP